MWFFDKTTRIPNPPFVAGSGVCRLFSDRLKKLVDDAHKNYLLR